MFHCITSSRARLNSRRAASRWPACISRWPTSKWRFDSAISASMGSTAGAAAGRRRQGRCDAAATGGGATGATAVGVERDAHPATTSRLTPMHAGLRALGIRFTLTSGSRAVKRFSVLNGAVCGIARIGREDAAQGPPDPAAGHGRERSNSSLGNRSVLTSVSVVRSKSRPNRADGPSRYWRASCFDVDAGPAEVLAHARVGCAGGDPRAGRSRTAGCCRAACRAG